MNKNSVSIVDGCLAENGNIVPYIRLGEFFKKYGHYNEVAGGYGYTVAVEENNKLTHYSIFENNTSKVLNRDGKPYCAVGPSYNYKSGMPYLHPQRKSYIESKTPGGLEVQVWHPGTKIRFLLEHKSTAKPTCVLAQEMFNHVCEPYSKDFVVTGFFCSSDDGIELDNLAWSISKATRLSPNENVYIKDDISYKLIHTTSSFLIETKDYFTGEEKTYEIDLMSRTNRSIKVSPQSFLETLNEKHEKELRIKKIEKILEQIDIEFPSLQSNYVFNETTNIYGIDLPNDIIKNAVYDPVSSNYYWTNSSGQFNSYKGYPSLITPEGELLYHKDGNLHNEYGPAHVSLANGKSQYFIQNKLLTENEFFHYNGQTGTVEFRDDFNYLHRDDGPAVIEFKENGHVSQQFYRHGINTFNVEIKKNSYIDVADTKSLNSKESGVRRINVTSKQRETSVPPVYPGYTSPSTSNTDLPKMRTLTPKEVEAALAVLRKNKSYILQYAQDLSLAANEIMNNRGLQQPPPATDDFTMKMESFDTITKDQMEALINSVHHVALGLKEQTNRRIGEMNNALNKEEEKIEIQEKAEVKKVIRSAPDLTGSKFSQVSNGFKFGFKKQVINNSSKLLAKKAVSLSPMKDNQIAEKFAQLCFLFGTAEIIQKLPISVAEKIKLSEEMRLNFSSTCRYVSGEIIGRDAVELLAYVLPTVLEMFKNMTTEEISEQADEFEQNQEEEDVRALEENNSQEELFRVQQQEQYAEVLSK